MSSGAAVAMIRRLGRPLKWAKSPRLILGLFYLCGQAFGQGHPEIENPHMSNIKVIGMGRV